MMWLDEGGWMNTCVLGVMEQHQRKSNLAVLGCLAWCAECMIEIYPDKSNQSQIRTTQQSRQQFSQQFVMLSQPSAAWKQALNNYVKSNLYRVYHSNSCLCFYSKFYFLIPGIENIPILRNSLHPFVLCIKWTHSRFYMLTQSLVVCVTALNCCGNVFEVFPGLSSDSLYQSGFHQPVLTGSIICETNAWPQCKKVSSEQLYTNIIMVNCILINFFFLMISFIFLYD